MNMSQTVDQVYVTEIKTTPERLWPALTEAEFTTRYWFGVRIESSWEPRVPVSFWLAQAPGEAEARGMQVNNAGEALSDTGVVVQYAPFTTLSYTFQSLWDAEARADTPGMVTFSLAPIAAGVTLTVMHERIPNRADLVDGFENGWSAILDNLKTLLETGVAYTVSAG
jgi:uncharacterized protein YndB with AHSA1/START domain